MSQFAQRGTHSNANMNQNKITVGEVAIYPIQHSVYIVFLFTSQLIDYFLVIAQEDRLLSFCLGGPQKLRSSILMTAIEAYNKHNHGPGP